VAEAGLTWWDGGETGREAEDVLRRNYEKASRGASHHQAILVCLLSPFLFLSQSHELEVWKE